MSLWQTTFIALGSNLQSPISQLEQAIEKLKQHLAIRHLRCSSFYQSKAMIIENSTEQPDYINAVIVCETQFSPLELLACLQNIELQQGRERIKRWAARTLDLDILLYADQNIKSSQLTIPHPGLLQRNFVVYPLYELTGEMQISGKSLAQVKQQLDADGLIRLTHEFSS